MYPIFSLVLAFANISAFASTGSATVVVLRGSAKTGDGKAIAEKQKINPGSTVITSQRSFVRLLFADNTQLNVGPDTTMKIEQGPAGSASIIDLVGGQIRAKVTKDPLANTANGPVKEKMVIKTKTAAMGVRGTDFNVSFNSKNNVTALVTFEGNVAMAKMAAGANPMAALRQDKGVQAVGAGQFSGSSPDQALASIPVKISPAQLGSLESNSEFKGLGEATEKKAPMASPVPPGVDPKGFASGAEKSLKDAVAKSVGSDTLNAVVAEAKAKEPPAAKVNAPPEGFVNKSTGEYAPRAGGFIDLSSGRYVPPPAGSSFDANTGVFVPPAAMGTVTASGMYVPPKGVDLDPVKGFVAEAKPAAATAVAAANGAPAPGTRAPSGAGPAAGAPPPPVNALLVAMNESVKPENSTQAVTLNNSFSGGGSIVSGGQFNNTTPPPPPPPGQLPPPPPLNTDPQNPRPVSGNCATDNSCGGVNTPPPPGTSTNVHFQVNVTD